MYNFDMEVGINSDREDNNNNNKKDKSSKTDLSNQKDIKNIDSPLKIDKVKSSKILELNDSPEIIKIQTTRENNAITNRDSQANENNNQDFNFYENIYLKRRQNKKSSRSHPST